MSASRRILVGEFGRPHGVRGLIHVRSHTAEPAAIASYGPLSDEGGDRRFVLKWLADGLVQVEGVADRDAAAKLTGTRLYVMREVLPQPAEDEFYLTDLIGLRAETEAGEEIGTVSAVEDFGAGSVVTLRDANGRETLLPFTRAVVPVVEVAAGRIVVIPPGEREVPPQPGEAEASDTPRPRRPSMRRRSGGRDVA
ncbi:16S rRNA processing protein RimM [Roseomonas sp. SSH11]|uniref:Ribosome maturation factor RimM n=1 Tax=Pararoseomonas baculiformis TaxID=2820812 RepID=A0ABS4AJM5_9PROT|nr:ribosome maturation factor RimM [Pararoseomonas baculiformis]MBP0447222.1 16S rRNA processing protein RimM [Pararoseomonas baculiformis]